MGRRTVASPFVINSCFITFPQSTLARVGDSETAMDESAFPKKKTQNFQHFYYVARARK